MSRLVSLASENSEIVTVLSNALKVYFSGMSVEIQGTDPLGATATFLRERVTGAFPTITTDHGFIHEGIAYTFSGSQSV